MHIFVDAVWMGCKTCSAALVGIPQAVVTGGWLPQPLLHLAMGVLATSPQTLAQSGRYGLEVGGRGRPGVWLLVVVGGRVPLPAPKS